MIRNETGLIDTHMYGMFYCHTFEKKLRTQMEKLKISMKNQEVKIIRFFG